MLRGGLGLISLLLGVGLLFYLWTLNVSTVEKAGRPLHDKAEQISGRDANGVPADQSLTVTADNAGGHLRSLLVTDVVAGGAMETLYGIKIGDRITVEGNYDVTTNDDFGMAKSMLVPAYQGGQAIEVIRNGKKLTLPLAPGSPDATAATPTPVENPAVSGTPASAGQPPVPSAAPVAAPAPPPEPPKTPTQQALDILKHSAGQ